MDFEQEFTRLTKKCGPPQGVNFPRTIITSRDGRRDLMGHLSEETDEQFPLRTGMRNATKRRVERATVRLTRLGGQGVLVPGQLIVTAAHVIGWSAEGDMAPPFANEFREPVETADGRTLLVTPFAVEPVADIAILGTLDDHGAPAQAEAFEAFCESVKPVAVCRDDLPLFTPVPVHILTPRGRWVAGEATQCNVTGQGLVIAAREDIVGGTSGGPVVTDAGRLLGVVSGSGGSDGESREGYISRLTLTAPAWLVRRMLDPTWELRAMRKYQSGRAGQVTMRATE
jgi:S1-C subfamily serine protease